MKQTVGRPIGSRDKNPREKRTKLQCHIDGLLGISNGPKKDLHLEFQQPCEMCKSCVRLEYKLPHAQQQQQPDFLVRALMEHIPVKS